MKDLVLLRDKLTKRRELERHSIQATLEIPAARLATLGYPHKPDEDRFYIPNFVTKCVKNFDVLAYAET